MSDVSTEKAELDQAIAAVSAEVDAAAAAINAIEQKNTAPEVLDIAAELDLLRGVHDRLAAAVASVTGGVTDTPGSGSAAADASVPSSTSTSSASSSAPSSVPVSDQPVPSGDGSPLVPSSPADVTAPSSSDTPPSSAA